jgi:integrase/recombinase XerD
VRIPAGADLRAYLKALGARRASSSTLYQARFVLPRFLAHLKRQGVRDLRSINEDHLLAYARSLREVPGRRGSLIAPASVRCFLSVVRRFFAWLAEDGRILTNPARELPLPKVRRLPRAIPNEAEACRLIETLPTTRTGARDRTILELLYGTGIRVGDCARLDVMDLQLSERSLLVRDGKGGKDRLVPVPARAAVALGAYLREVRPALASPGESALFVSAVTPRRLSREAVETLVRRRGQAIGLRVSPHLLRHACATHLLRGGADIRHIQELLGHRRLDTTALYTRIEIRDLRQALLRAHPRERAWRVEFNRARAS